jgi:N-hydroxyarylamine O-acetyltransferase
VSGGFLLQPQQVDAYLERVGFDAQPSLDAAGLAALHRAHLVAVPFENLDMHRGVPIRLDPAHLYDKIVQRRRGGFCYELNGLFALLLEALGFHVERFAASVRGQDGSYGFDHAHLLLSVTLEQGFLCDVGFGQSYLEPLPLVEGEYVRPEARFTLQRDGARFVYAEYAADGAVANGYRFVPAAQPLTAFVDACAWTQTSPDSHFVRSMVCSRATQEGRITLTGNRFIETVRGARHERLVSPKDVPMLLASRFGFPPDDQVRS